VSLILALPLAFAAGLLTILSPCILPLAPIVVAAARADDPRAPLALAAGLALTFAVVGSALAAFGVEVGGLVGVRFVAAAIMVAAGIVLLVPKAADRMEVFFARLGGVSRAFAEAREHRVDGRERLGLREERGDAARLEPLRDGRPRGSPRARHEIGSERDDRLEVGVHVPADLGERAHLGRVIAVA